MIGCPNAEFVGRGPLPNCGPYSPNLKPRNEFSGWFLAKHLRVRECRPIRCEFEEKFAKYWPSLCPRPPPTCLNHTIPGWFGGLGRQTVATPNPRRAGVGLQLAGGFQIPQKLGDFEFVVPNLLDFAAAIL